MSEVEFLFANNWFQERYVEKMDPGKYPTFKAALNLFLRYGGETIVETGTIRQKDDWGAGYSTYLFGDFCQRYNKKLYSVDNDPKHLAISTEVTAPFKDHITYVLDDSVHFLDKFNSRIDLLYLDSLDCCENPEADNTKPQTHQLHEVQAAYSKLAEHAVILLDDCNFTNGGKCRLARKYLLERSWTLVLEYYQSLWVG